MATLKRRPLLTIYDTITDLIHGTLGSNLHADSHPQVHTPGSHVPGPGTPSAIAWTNASGGGTGYADDKHVHDGVSLLSNRQFVRTGALYETIDRSVCANQNPLTSGQTYCVGIYLPAGLVVQTITWMAGTTPEATGTHCWSALADANRVIRAVSADNTGAAFFSASVEHPFTMTSPGGGYTIPADGIYYCCLCVVAGTMPTLACANSIGALTLLAPTKVGMDTTARTTPPPITSTTLAAFTGQSFSGYAYVS